MSTPPYTLILELLSSGMIRATVRTREGRTIGYTDSECFPGENRALLIRALLNFLPSGLVNGKVDASIAAMNPAASAVMNPPKRRRGNLLGVFVDYKNSPDPAFFTAVKGDVFITTACGRSFLFEITNIRQSHKVPCHSYTSLRMVGCTDAVESEALRLYNAGRRCAFPPVRKFWDSTPRGLSSVRLRLHPFEWVNCSYSWHNGEGMSWIIERYRSVWGIVEKEMSSGGRDCDGRHVINADFYADANELDAEPPNERHEAPRPRWVAVKTEQRDAYAEASNY